MAAVLFFAAAAFWRPFFSPGTASRGFLLPDVFAAELVPVINGTTHQESGQAKTQEQKADRFVVAGGNSSSPTIQPKAVSLPPSANGSASTVHNASKEVNATVRSLPAKQGLPCAYSEKDHWIKFEPGMRPAYVGIHGGTAPLSLIQTRNGTLFAFTGQTGNDFLHILKGGTSNSSSSSGTANKEEQPSPAVDQVSGGDRVSLVGQAATADPAVAAPQQAEQPAPVAPSKPQVQPSRSGKESRSAQGIDRKERISGQQANMRGPGKRARPSGAAQTTTRKSLLAKEPACTEESQQIIIAKGELAATLVQRDACEPFGFGTPPVPPDVLSGKDAAPRLPQLKLGSYKALLVP